MKEPLHIQQACRCFAATLVLALPAQNPDQPFPIRPSLSQIQFLLPSYAGMQEVTMTPVLYAHHELRGMYVLPRRRPVHIRSFLPVPTFGPLRVRCARRAPGDD